VVSHTGRPESLDAAAAVCRMLIAEDVVPVVPLEDRDAVCGHDTSLAIETLVEGEASDGVGIADLELVIVLGGDGTILRAAELARGSSAPLLGINLGHMGFLAEAEKESLEESLRRALDRNYEVEERMTLAVRVKVD